MTSIKLFAAFVAALVVGAAVAGHPQLNEDHTVTVLAKRVPHNQTVFVIGGVNNGCADQAVNSSTRCLCCAWMQETARLQPCLE